MRDGWISPGDLARRDDEGYLYIVDRKNDKIISGGVNIYPREIEEAIARHPAVREVAVFGVPDDYWGEAINATVVLGPGRHGERGGDRRSAARTSDGTSCQSRSTSARRAARRCRQGVAARTASAVLGGQGAAI